MFIVHKLQELQYLVRSYFTIKSVNPDVIGKDAKEVFSLLDEVISLYSDNDLLHKRVLVLFDEFISTAINAFRNSCYDNNRRIFIERLGWLGKKEYSYARDADEAFISFFFNVMPDLSAELSRSRKILEDNNGQKYIDVDINNEICKVLGANIVNYHASRHEDFCGELLTLFDGNAKSKFATFTSELHANAKAEMSEFLSTLMDKKANEISAIKADVKNVNEFYSKEFDNLKDKAEQNDLLSTEMLRKAELLFQSARDVHGKTNREAMAGSFEVISGELKTPLFLWAGGLVISLLSIFGLGVYFYIDGMLNVTLPQLLSRAILITPMVWLAWFSGRQYNHTSKLRQDYRYKSAVARAYHGYKSETGEDNDQMHNHLLQNIVTHFSDNPVRLYDKNEPSMPVEDFLKKISPDHIVDIWKTAMQAKDDKDSKAK